MKNKLDGDCIFALEMLIADFDNVNYALLVNNELKKLKEKEVDIVKFGTQDEEVDLEISREASYLKYCIWNEQTESQIEGTSTLESPFVVKLIEKTTSKYTTEPLLQGYKA